MSATPATRLATFHLDAPPERVLPLFTAAGEREWAEGWDPVILSGNGERGSAFRTRSPEGRETVWTVIAYDSSAGRASYARLAQNSNIGIVDVTCAAAAGGGTDVGVRYTLTPLSAEGEAFVERFLSAPEYAQMIEEWRLATSAALARHGAR